MKEQFREAWEVNNRINMQLLDQLAEAALEASYAPRVRTVGKIFAHIHNVRLMWLGAMQKDQVAIGKIKSSADPDKAMLRKALLESGAAIGDLVERIAEKGKVSNFKRSPATFLAYMLAHEAHHRGQAIVALRLSGHKLGQEAVYGLWEWDRI